MEVKRVFRGVPKGEIYPVTYRPGDKVPPELVKAAKQAGADQEPEERPKSDPIKPGDVSQMGPDGKMSRSGKGGGKGKVKQESDAAAGESGDGKSGADDDKSGDGKGGDGKDGAGDGKGDAGASDDPKLGGLG